MSNTAMVFGYFIGFIDLVNFFPWLGDTQMKVFCIVGTLVFITTLAITCFAVKEKQHVENGDQDDL